MIQQNYAKNTAGDELLSMLGNEKTVTSSEPELKSTLISEGVVHKAYAFFEELFHQCGVIEAYWIPLRRPNEMVIRDIYIPSQHFAHGSYVQIPPEAYEEVSSLKSGLVIPGWMHLHPKFDTFESGTDTNNSKNTLDMLLHNVLEGIVRTQVKNANYAVVNGEILLSHVLEDSTFSLPISEIAKIMHAYAKENGMSKLTQKEAEGYITNYLENARSEKIKLFDTHAKLEKSLIRYASSTVWNSFGKEGVLKLDGSVSGGFSENIYSQIWAKKYDKIKGTWGAPFEVGGDNGVPIGIVKNLEGDVKFTAQQMKDIVRTKIKEPRLEHDRLEEIAKKALVKKPEAAAPPGQPATVPTAQPAQPVIVDKPVGFFYQMLHDLWPRYFPIQEAKKAEPTLDTKIDEPKPKPSEEKKK